jgi:hypothetical protein
MAGQESHQANRGDQPSAEPGPVKWGGRLWILALVAIAIVILVLVAFWAFWPHPLAWQSPPPTELPWTAAPGLYQIPTPGPTAVPPAATPAP